MNKIEWLIYDDLDPPWNRSEIDLNRRSNTNLLGLRLRNTQTNKENIW